MKRKDDVEHFEHAGMTCRIVLDPEPPDPREWDKLVTLACWHRRAKLGDRQIQPMNFIDLIRMLKREGEEVLAVMPLWLYEHSGMTMHAADSRPGYPFSCPWDAGQVGWAYVTRSSAEKMGCVPGNSFTRDGATMTYDKAFYRNAIVEEVQSYDDYLTGRCYAYIVEDTQGDNVESCWGIYIERGPNALDYVRSEAKAAAEHAAEDEKKARKKWPKSAWKRLVARDQTLLGYEAWLKEERAKPRSAA